MVQVDAVDVSSCTDGTITVNATGGTGTLVYAIVPANTSPTGLFVTGNSLTVTNAMATANPAGFDIYVHDNNNVAPICAFLEEDLIINPAIPLSISGTPTDPECFDGLGSIDAIVSTGQGPFTYTLVDLSPADGIDYGSTVNNIVTTNTMFSGIGVGNYEITITDVNNCSATTAVLTINNATEITTDLIPILPTDADCNTATAADYGFSFTVLSAPAGTIEYSDDAGATWQASTDFTGLLPGTAVFPSIKITKASGAVCIKDFSRYTTQFPLDNLDITLSAIIIGCSDLQVTVKGSEGNNVPGYTYTYTDTPVGFDPNAGSTIWTSVIPAGSSHTFANLDPVTPQLPGLPLLVPGRTYVFYVKDAGNCVRQSNVDVNDIPGINLPIAVTTNVTPSCNAANNGQIVYTLNPTASFPKMRWEVYKLGTALPIAFSGTGATATNVAYNNTITVPGLGEGDYYIQINQVDGSDVDACFGGGKNAFINELNVLTAIPVHQRDISCNLPGLIEVTSIVGGGGGPYTYDLAGPLGFTALTGISNNPIQIPVNSPLGDYTVTIKDQYGCPVTLLPAITMSLSPNPTISVAMDNCSAPNSLTITAGSAAGNLRYALVASGAPAPTSFLSNGGVFNNLTIGSYDAYVIDGNGCTASTTADVHPNLQATASLQKSLGCGVGNEAELLINVTAGSGNYDYAISDTGGTLVARQLMATSTLTYTTSTAETYTIIIYDNNTSGPECSRSFTIEVPVATLPDFTLSPTPVSCAGYADGSISITEVNNGIHPIIYSILPNNGNFNPATKTYEDLPGNIAYTITATAANGCVSTRNEFIAEPNTITFNTLPVVTPFGCTSNNTSNNANIAVAMGSIGGGSGNYVRFEFVDNSNASILQDGVGRDYVFTDFSGGDILVRVYDDKGCSGETIIPVPAYDELISAAIHIDDVISCSTLEEDISIDVTGSLSTYGSDPANYEFRKLPSGSYQASNQFPDLPPGNYTFGIRNVNTACEITINHTVEDPNTFDVIVEKLSDAVCFEDDGSIRLTLTDAVYSGGFTWSIYNTNGTPADHSDDGAAISTGNSLNLGPTPTINVAAGNYLVEVVQNAFPNCSQQRLFSISTPSAALTLNPIDLTDVGCSNDQGSAAIAPSGGLAPYNINLTNNGTGTITNVLQTSAHLFQGLNAGLYTVSVTDALGCTVVFTDEFELLLPDPITGPMSFVGLVCQGDTNASISFSLDPRNVSANYRHILNSYNNATGSILLQTTAPQAAAVFTDLAPGFYNITVLDDMGCSYTPAVFIEIADPSETTAMLLTNQAFGCTTQAELELRATGGTAPYSWSTDGISFNAMNEINAANTHLFQNVSAGTYQYFVRDSFNCISTFSNEVTINPIAPLDVNFVDDKTVISLNCNGESNAIIEAKAVGGLGNYQYALFTDSALTNEIRPNQDTGLFTDLPVGSYYVRVQSEDCQKTSEEVLIQEPVLLVVVPVPNNITCSGSEDGSIVLNVTGGSGNYQYAISPNLNQFDDENVFDDLAAGDYTVIVQDSNGCFEIFDFTLTEPTVLEMGLTSGPEICAGDEDGSISVTISGGTAPYSTSINSNDDTDFVEGRFTFDTLSGGSYIIFVKDAMGCILNDVIIVEAGANLNAEIEVVYECSGDTPNNHLEFSFEDPAVTSDVLYGLDTNDPTEMVLLADFENLPAGPHIMTIAHANGCVNTIAFEIEEFEPLEVLAEQQNLNEITALASGGKTGYTFYFNEIENNNDDGKFYIKKTDTYIVKVVDENGCEATTSIFMEFIDIEIPNFFTPDGDGKNDRWIPRNIEQYPDIFITIYDRYGREVHRIRDDQDGWIGFYQDAEMPTGDYWYIIKLNGETDEREFVGHFTLYR